MSSPLHLFAGYGIELEYMVVDCETLDIRPCSDVILKNQKGEIVSDLEDGAITFSNELAAHLIELKTSGPASTLSNTSVEFSERIAKANRLLKPHNMMLLPTAMHPWMNPSKEAKLWSHESSEIYESYNRIFDCTGHGWTNLQSTHINLPFFDDAEFTKLHSAIRFVLPLLPALAASSPFEGAAFSGSLDRRLIHYQKNQAKVPSIAGNVIPEPIISIADYHESILQKIYKDIQPYDPASIMQEDWLNSRGAIARFERQTIEIRVLDIQECPASDIALVKWVCSLVKVLTEERFGKQYEKLSVHELKSIFDQSIEEGMDAVIDSRPFLSALGIDTGNCKISHLVTSLLERANPSESTSLKFDQKDYDFFEVLLSQGNLSQRILKKVGRQPNKSDLVGCYRKLADCLASNEIFHAK